MMVNHRMSKTMVTGVVVLFCAAQTGLAEDYVEQGLNGSINWTKGEVHATGIGVPPEKYLKYPARARAMAVRAAKVVALSNLLEQIQGVHVDSQTVVKDMAVDSDIIRTQASGLVRHASSVGHPHYMEDGSVEVEMAVNYRQTLAPKVMQLQQQEHLAHQQAPTNTVTTALPTVSADAQDAITGLVIDARGLGMQPSMAPKVLNNAGGVIFSVSQVQMQPEDGLVAYATSPDDANVKARVGQHPIVVRATKVRNFGDVVIGDDKAKKLDNSAGFSAVIRNAKIAIIL